MSAIKAFLANQPAREGQCEAQLSIIVMSMSRLFCELNGGRKIFSIAFPFKTLCESGELSFYSREGILVDSQISSQILALVEGGGVLDAADFYKFIDPIFDVTEVSPSIWTLLRELMLAEDAYVRYDWDEERADGHRHPIHHLDVHYSAGNSFKIGLPGGIDQATLISILNIEADCHYLNAAVPAHAAATGRKTRRRGFT